MRRSLGPTLPVTSILPTARVATSIRTDYLFANWSITDLAYMVQRVHDEGTFSFCAQDAGGTVNWNEDYDEGWVRGRANQNYQFTDQHAAGPHQPAQTMEKFFGEKFTIGPNNTLLIGRHKVSSWDFTMTAKFDMRNAWRNDWVPLIVGANNNFASFGGEGNHTWKVAISAYAVGGGGGFAMFESNGNDQPLYGFSQMIYHQRGTAPPVGQWTYGANSFHEVSNEAWTESWKTGQPKPTGKYTGGYQ